MWYARNAEFSFTRVGSRDVTRVEEATECVAVGALDDSVLMLSHSQGHRLLSCTDCRSGKLYVVASTGNSTPSTYYVVIACW